MGELMMMMTLRPRTAAAPHRQRRAAIPVLALTFALLALALGAASAAAHVGVLPADVRPASNETFTVRVPNEKTEPTVRVRVVFPDGLVVSRFEPKPGWQREVEKDGAGRITGVTWSGGQIGDGQYDDFRFIARTPQQEGPVAFRAYQTYAAGETVEWVNAENQQNPAAFVQVRAAAAAAGGAPSIENAGQAAAPAAPALA